MRNLGDEIAVLDGLGDLPDYYASRGVIDASSGANYSGGSSYAPGLPLLPSSAGLADSDLTQYGIQAGVLPPRTGVIDASGGGNYSGGSSYAPGLPLLPSSAGLASLYEGQSLDDVDTYWGSTMGVEQGSYSTHDVIDASGGANYSGGSSYAPGLPLLPSSVGLAGVDLDDYWTKTPGIDDSYYTKDNVIDASGGANYSGGSSYAPGLPLLPSSVGLAGLDGLSDAAFQRMLPSPAVPAFKRVAGTAPMNKTKSEIARLRGMVANPSLMPSKRQAAYRSMAERYTRLANQRKMRAGLVRAAKVAAARPNLRTITPISL